MEINIQEKVVRQVGYLQRSYQDERSKKNIKLGRIKIDQLDVTCFIISVFNSQHVSNVSTSILRSLRLICCVILWVVLLWFDGCWCYGVVRLGWCGILMQAEALLQPA